MQLARGGSTGRRSGHDPTLYRAVFVAILGLWALLGFVSGQGQDALPYVAAGSLVHDHPADIYSGRGGNVFDVSDRFRQRWCDGAPAGTDCAENAVAYASTPPILPIAMLLHGSGAKLGTTLMSLGASLMLAGGMWLLWKRLVGRTPRAPVILVFTALLATPVVAASIRLGQTSPILFLSVCLGISDTRTRRQIATGVTWSFATLLKLFPAPLVILLAFRRRWRALWAAGVAAVVLTVFTALLVTGDIWPDFLGNLGGMNHFAARYYDNGSVYAGIVRLFTSGDPSFTVELVAQAGAIALAVALCVVCMRWTGDDTRWAVAYVALLVASPIVWGHYLTVVVGACAVVLADRRRLTERQLWLLPVVALAASTPEILVHRIPNAARPNLQVVMLLVACAAIVWAAVSRGTTSDRRSGPTGDPRIAPADHRARHAPSGVGRPGE